MSISVLAVRLWDRNDIPPPDPLLGHVVGSPEKYVRVIGIHAHTYLLPLISKFDKPKYKLFLLTNRVRCFTEKRQVMPFFRMLRRGFVNLLFLELSKYPLIKMSLR